MATTPNPKKPKPVVKKPYDNDENFVSPEVVQRFKEKFYRVFPRDADRLSEEAINWFRAIVIKNTNVNREKMLQAETYGKKTGTEKNQLIGKLYFYEYAAEQAGDPEHDIYDRYPLTFFFNSTRTKDGKFLLWGLNLHYLAPKERMILLMNLLQLRSSKVTRPGMRLNITWKLIKAVTKHKLYEKAVHAYRVDRLKSRLVEIPATDWSIVVFLSLQKWIAIDSQNQLPQSDYRNITQRRTREHMKKNR